MAPMGNKRKRNYNQEQHHDGPNRPSPHRPDNLGLAQQNQHDYQQSQSHPDPLQTQYGQRGGRRSSRGGRGNHGAAHGMHAAQDDTRQASRRDNRDYGPRNTASTAPSPAPADSGRQTPNTATVPRAPEIKTKKVAIAPTESLPPPAPYDYEILTTDRVSRWQEIGRMEVLDHAHRALSQLDSKVLSTVFQELLRAGLDGHIATVDAGKAVEGIFASIPLDPAIDGASLFLDAITILTDAGASNSRLAEILFATGISPEMMREQLDGSILRTLDLVRSTFDKLFIRKQTNLLYRQSNYNLLREESEGYSKLVTELFTVTETNPPTAEVVENTFENMKALIGAFDLDTGRVLDVTMDVFASLLVKHFRFFVKLLRASSWWPELSKEEEEARIEGIGGLPAWAEVDHSSWTTSEEEKEAIDNARLQRDRIFWDRAKGIGLQAFFELGGRKLIDEESVAEQVDSAEKSDGRSAAEIEETKNWIKLTRTMPPSGNYVAAQLLGFKLQFYASVTRDGSDTLPMNLIYLAALLIKIGFISLRDLYPHLHPKDEAMEAVKDKQMKEKEARDLARLPGGGVLNALARAGALADDTLPAPVKTGVATPSKSESATAKPEMARAGDDDKEDLPEASDQKVQLLKSLLCIGAIPEALYLLGRFTWLADAFPDLPEHIHRIIHHCLATVYRRICPFQDRDSVREAAGIPDDDQSGVSKGEIRLVKPTPPKVLRWAQMDKNDAHDGIDYRFYWDEWTDNVPVCQNTDDVVTLCNTFLNFSGVKIGQDVSLLMKLARLGKHSLNEDSSPSNKHKWFALCKRLLCPALSMTEANPAIVNEVFELLKFWPTQSRYSVYAEWVGGQVSRFPDIRDAFDIVRAKTKDLLKRINKTNTKPTARMLAKIACASPGIAFTVVLTQIESYSNLTDVILECGRFFTYMGYDVFSWCLMNMLGREGRSKVALDGLHTSKWLQSLSDFCARILKRYHNISSLPILQYVLEQLHQGNTTELRILRDIVTSMSGITPDMDFTDAQIQAMGGGDLLQTLTLRQLLDRRHESKLSSKRLVKTLVTHGLIAPLLIVIAQQRQMDVFNPEVELKIVSESFDVIHIVFTQYLEMVRTGLSTEEFEELLPDPLALIEQFGLDPSLAFMIHRKSLALAIESYDLSHGRKRKMSNTAKVQPRGDVEASTPKPSAAATSSSSPDTTAVASKVAEEIGANGETSSIKAVEAITDTGISDGAEVSGPWHPVLQGLFGRLRDLLPNHVQNNISLPFYVTFWQLSLHDVMAPYKSYTEEENRQKALIAKINADRSDLTPTIIKRKEQEKKAITESQRKLMEEMKTHLANYSHVRERLEIEKKYWFKDFAGKWKLLGDALLQECFLPRLLLSPLDSYYTWKMVNLLHSSGTPEFKTMFFFDRIFEQTMLTNLIVQCTRREAENLGRFLKEILSELSTWHAHRDVYERKAYGTKKDLPGFAQRITKDGKLERFLDYEDFRRLLYKWHRQLLEALKTCLSNTEWAHEMNAITVIRSLVKHYPAVTWIGNVLCTAVQMVKTNEEPEETRRQDLWVASSSVLGQLGARKKDWVMPQAFYYNDTTTKQQGSSRAASTAPKSPKLEETGSATGLTASTTTPLNAAAPAFSPTSGTSAVERKPSGAGKGEIEDGEVEDGDSAVSKNAATVGTPTAKTASSQSESRAASSDVPSTSAAMDLKARALTNLAVQRQQNPPAPTPQSGNGLPSYATAGSAAQPTGPANGTVREVPRSARESDRSTLGTRTPQPGHRIPSRPEPARALSGTRIGHALPGKPQSLHPLPSLPPAGRPHDSRDQGRRDPSRESRQAQIYDSKPDLLSRPGSVAATDRSRDQAYRGGGGMPLPVGPANRQHPADIPSRPSSRDVSNPHGHTTPNRPPPEQYGRSDPRNSLPPVSGLGGPGRHHETPPVQTIVETDRRIPINAERAAFLQSAIEAPVPHQPNGTREEDGRRGRHPRSDAEVSAGPEGVPASGRDEPLRPRGDIMDSRGLDNNGPRSQPRDRPNAYPAGPSRGRNTGRGGLRGGLDRADPSHSNMMRDALPRDVAENNYGRLRHDDNSRGRLTSYQDDSYGRLNPASTDPASAPTSAHDRVQADMPPRREVLAGSTPQANSNGPRESRHDASSARSERPVRKDEPPPSTPNAPAQAPADLSGIHPSRLQQVAGTRPTPIQTLVPIPVQQQSPTGAPSGPRSSHPRSAHPDSVPPPSPAPSTPGSGRAPPTGPGGGGADRRSGARRFANINETLQLGGQPALGPTGPSLDRNGNLERGTSIRGRGAIAAGRENSSAQPSPRSMLPPQMPPQQQPNGGPGDHGRRGGAPAQPPTQAPPSQQQQLPSQVIVPRARELESARNAQGPGQNFDRHGRDLRLLQQEPRHGEGNRDRGSIGSTRGSDRDARPVRGAGGEESRKRGREDDAGRELRGANGGRDDGARNTRSLRGGDGAVGGPPSDIRSPARAPSTAQGGPSNQEREREQNASASGNGRDREHERDSGRERGRGRNATGNDRDTRDVRGNRTQQYPPGDQGHNMRRGPGGPVGGSFDGTNGMPSRGRDGPFDGGRMSGGQTNDGRKRAYPGEQGPPAPIESKRPRRGER